MPLYEFACAKHGSFELYRSMDKCTSPANCPECNSPSGRIITASNIHIVQGGKALPLGSGSPGKIISSKETGGMGIFIPSYGALEQAEVDYLAEGAIENEKTRIKKKTHRKTQAVVQAFADLANRTKKGQKAKAIRQAIKETGGFK
jgi:putative FmdB family regulatory protein